MSIKLHPKHGVAPVMEICKLSGYSTGRIILLGRACNKVLDKDGNLPRYVVTGEIHPRIYEELKKGGVCVVGPNRFDCVLMNEAGAESLFEKHIHGNFVHMDKEAWDHFLTLLPKPPQAIGESGIGKEFPKTFGDAPEEKPGEPADVGSSSVDEPTEEDT